MTLRIVLAVLVAANVISAIGVARALQPRQVDVQLPMLMPRVRDELNIEFGRLQLEQATWAESNRIDQVARNKLGMKFPAAGEIVVVRP